MDVARQNLLRERQKRADVVAEMHFDLLRADDFLVHIDVVDARERMQHLLTEDLAVFGLRQHVRIRIHAAGVQQVRIHQMVADFVRRIAQQQMHLLHAAGDATKQHGEAVAAQNRKRDADHAAGELRTNVRRDLVNRHVIALRPRDDGLRDRDHVMVLHRKAFVLPCLLQGGDHLGRQIIALAENRAADAANHRSYCTHSLQILLCV